MLNEIAKQNLMISVLIVQLFSKSISIKIINKKQQHYFTISQKQTHSLRKSYFPKQNSTSQHNL